MRRFLLLLVDLSLVAVATVLALVLRDNFSVSFNRFYELLPYLGASLLAATVIFPAFGLNRALWRFSSLWDYLRIVGASTLIVLGAVGVGFVLNRLEGVARALPILQGLLIIAALVSVRVSMRLRHDIRKSKSTQRLENTAKAEAVETVLVVGLNTVAELFVRSVNEFTKDRIKVAGLLGRTDRHSGRRLRQYMILGTAEQLESVLRDLELHGVFVNRIVVTQSFDSLKTIAQRALLRVERESDIQIDLFAERIGLHEDRDRTATTPNEQEGTANDRRRPSISADLTPALVRPYWRAKRALDVIGAVCLIVLLAPLMAMVTLIVAIDVGLPTIFWQQRPGLRGRPLKLFKFRTMRVAHDNSGYRVPDEKRSSAIGRFLRRSRLDELPQLFNILAGDMSFVGPRPLLPVDQSQEQSYRLLARPGLTGWAQVNGGRDISPEDKSALDVWYIKNAALWLDLKIVCLTFATLIGGERTNVSAVCQARQEVDVATLGEPPATQAAHPARAVA